MSAKSTFAHPHRHHGGSEPALGQRFAGDQADVVEREHHQADADHEPDAAAREAQRDRRAEEHEDEARDGERELLLDLDVVRGSRCGTCSVSREPQRLRALSPESAASGDPGSIVGRGVESCVDRRVYSRPLGGMPRVCGSLRRAMRLCTAPSTRQASKRGCSKTSPRPTSHGALVRAVEHFRAELRFSPACDARRLVEKFLARASCSARAPVLRRLHLAHRHLAVALVRRRSSSSETGFRRRAPGLVGVEVEALQLVGLRRRNFLHVAVVERKLEVAMVLASSPCCRCRRKWSAGASDRPCRRSSPRASGWYASSRCPARR